MLGPMLSRRQILRGLGGSALAALPGALLLSRPAGATTARAISLPELVGLSEYALVATPTDAYSRWESLGNSNRIVTYVRIEVTHPIDGRPPADTSLMVRTLGGRVGDIGQLVHGEARLQLGSPAVVFLAPSSTDGVLGVTAMAQGHYPLSLEALPVARLGPSPSMPALVNVDGSAVQRLVSKTVAEAEGLVSEIMLRR
jgi:hypothetical protein